MLVHVVTVHVVQVTVVNVVNMVTMLYGFVAAVRAVDVRVIFVDDVRAHRDSLEILVHMRDTAFVAATINKKCRICQHRQQKPL